MPYLHRPRSRKERIADQLGRIAWLAVLALLAIGVGVIIGAGLVALSGRLWPGIGS